MSPEQQIQLIQVPRNLSSKPFHPSFDQAVPSRIRGSHARPDHLKLSQAGQDVLVQYRITSKPDVSKEMAGLLIPDPADFRIAGKKVASSLGIGKRSDQPL